MTDQEKEELINFGKDLMAKGNLPSSVRQVFKTRVKDRAIRDEILAEVFHVNLEKKTDHRTSAQKTEDLELMKARHVFTDFSDQNKKSLQLGLLTMGLAMVALLFGVQFAVMTFLQGLLIVLIYLLVTKKKAYHLVRGIILAFLGLIVVEMIFFGFPEPILGGGEDVLSDNRSGLLKIFNQITPFIYLGYKIAVVMLLIYNLILKMKFDKLPDTIRYKVDPV